jgi:hypothetical protein
MVRLTEQGVERRTIIEARRVMASAISMLDFGVTTAAPWLDPTSNW